MPSTAIPEHVDYLVIGHVTKDLHPEGSTLGGTASFSSLTARSLGLKVGIVTSCSDNFPLDQLDQCQIHIIPSKETTTFENIYRSGGREQFLHHHAAQLGFEHIPAAWISASIIHLGPVAQEVDIELIEHLPDTFIGLTPQGWFRKWDSQGKINLERMPFHDRIVEKTSAIVISVEDVQGDELYIEELARQSSVLVVTEGASGARLYWNGDMRYFHAPPKPEIDPTGAGDIFATAFFYRFQSTGDAWEAARFATILSSNSVTRKGLLAIPTSEEIITAQSEIFTKMDQL